MRADGELLRDLVRQLHLLRPASVAQVSLVGLMAGALYALLTAAELDYDDVRAFPALTPFANEFATALEAIGRDSAPPALWLAGFYFNSALMRLDAIDTRLAIVLGSKPNYGGKVRESVNSLKHDVDAHLSGTKPVVFSDAIAAAERLTAQLRQAVP